VIIHHVRFTLKEGTDLRIFRRGLKSLLTAPSVAAGWFGEPAKIEPLPESETGWHLALFLHFRTIKDHQAYLVDPLHASFVAECGPMCTEVKVLDAAL
jgi:hypothetical protein